MPDYSHVICRCYMCFLFFQVHPFQACLFHAFQAYPFQELILSVQFFSVFLIMKLFSLCVFKLTLWDLNLAVGRFPFS